MYVPLSSHGSGIHCRTCMIHVYVHVCGILCVCMYVYVCAASSIYFQLSNIMFSSQIWPVTLFLISSFYYD